MAIKMSNKAFLASAMVAFTMINQAKAQSSNSTTDSSTSTVISSLVLNGVIFIIEMTAFFILRPKFPKIYRPKSYLGLESERVAAPSDSMFGWVPEFLRTPTSVILYKNGLDAYQFVAFCEMMIWFFVPVWLFTWIFLMPLYAAQSGVGQTGFNMFTYGNVGKSRSQQLRLIGVLFANWIIILYWIWVMRRFIASFIKNRQEFLLSPEHKASAQARTILITGIPNDYLSERKLSNMYSHFPGGVAKVWLNRDLQDMPDLFDQRLKACNKLEGAIASVQKIAFKKIKKGKVTASNENKDAELDLGVIEKYLTKKERPTHKLGALGCYGEKVDTLDWCREEIPRLTKELDERRRAAETDYETYRPASAAFIMFNTQIAAHMAVKTHAHHQPYRMANHYLEAHPLDVIWENLGMNPYAVKIRTAIGWAITIGLVLFWTLVTVVVGFISNVTGTAQKISWLRWLLTIPTEVRGIIQGILPVVLLAVANILLVMFLRFLGRFSGIPTRSGVELSLFDRMAIFNIIQNFLLLTIISGVSNGINEIVDVLKQPAGLPGLLAEKVPNASTFFLSFVLLQGLTGCASGFLQIAPLIIYYVKKFLLASTPRKLWHIENDMPSVAWGTLFASTTLLSVIGIGYTIMAPIMNGFAMGAFILLFVMYKYNFTYVYNMSGATETAGLFFPKAINFVFAAMYLQMLIQAVLFFISQYAFGGQSAIPEGVFMVILMVITIGFHYFFIDSYGSLYTALPLSLVQPEDGNVAGATSSNTPNEKKGLLSDAQKGAPSGVVDANSNRAASGTAAEHDNEHEDPLEAFTPIPLKDNQRDIWIADDVLGLGRAENERNRSAGISTTMRGATRDEKGKIETDLHCPPGEILL